MSNYAIIDVDRIFFGWTMIKVMFLNGGTTLILTREELEEFKKMLEDITEEPE